MNDIFASPTFRLFVNQGGFWSGFASVLDLTASGHRYNMSKTPEEADLESIFSDWSAVGKDLASAIEDYEKTETSSEEIEQDSFKS